MIDIHTHALPGIDDGAKDEEESLKMLHESYVQGVGMCFLTPHCEIHSESAITEFVEKRAECFEKLKKYLNDEEEIPVLKLGAEVYCDHDISRHEDIDKLCLEGTNDILVEFPPMAVFEWLPECIHNLNVRKMRVIIAHIDRYPKYEKIMEELGDMNIVYQINASRLLTINGRRLVRRILRHDERFVVACDMHNTTSRPCRMGKAKETAARKFAGERLFIYSLNEL